MLINVTWLINTINLDSVETWMLKDYKAIIKLKENVNSSFWISQANESHFAKKFPKTAKQDILKHVASGGNKWSLLIVALRKQDGILHICEDYKLGMKHKICSDSYLIPSIDSALHALGKMKFFTKIDFKIAYQQIQTDDNFKEIPIINTSIGFT